MTVLRTFFLCGLSSWASQIFESTGERVPHAKNRLRNQCTNTLQLFRVVPSSCLEMCTTNTLIFEENFAWSILNPTLKSSISGPIARGQSRCTHEVPTHKCRQLTVFKLPSIFFQISSHKRAVLGQSSTSWNAWERFVLVAFTSASRHP